MNKTSDDTGKPIARVHDKFLYASDIVGIIAPGTSKEDSTNIIKNYINSWIEQTLVLQKAEANLEESEKSMAIEKQLQDYRNSLVIYAYEKELVEQNLDTNISDEEISTYYQNNKQNFELKNNIVKVLYIKLNKQAPNIDKVKEWYRSDSASHRRNLEEYCFQFADNFYLDDNTWLYFEDLLKEIPIKTYNQEEFLKNNRQIEFQDSVNLYLVNIKGFQIKESASPLSFERDNIRNIILNKRKLELIDRMKRDIYNEALNKNYFETYKQ
jgi:hypothetical protein